MAQSLPEVDRATVTLFEATWFAPKLRVEVEGVLVESGPRYSAQAAVGLATVTLPVTALAGCRYAVDSGDR